MAARLTDAQKKKITADYVELGSYAAAGRLNGVSDKTVKAIVRDNPETSRISEQKKEQNTLDMLAYMDSRKEQAQGIIDDCLRLLPEKLKEASATQISTTMGIVIDKFAKLPESGVSIQDVLKNMETLSDIVMNPAPNRNIEDFE